MLKAVIIGAGRMGTEGFRTPFCYTHLGAYKNFLTRIKLVGLCDNDSEKARFAAERTNTPWYTDAAQMLHDERPDIVSICTPIDVRYELIRECLRAKVKGIWLEKPVAHDIDTATRVMDAVKIMGNIPVQVNYIRRFDLAHQQIRENLHSGKMGEIQWMRVLYRGGMLNNGAHFVDLARWWEIPEKLVKFTETDKFEGTCTEVELQTTKGRVRMLEGGLSLQVEGPGPSLVFPGIDTWKGYERVEKIGPPTAAKNAWPPIRFMENALENLLNCLEGKEKLICPIHEAHESLVLADRLATERRLKW